ncbi:MAG TPA: magnesium/cobalt transporter CorA [Gammaproteobacteria bacterium]|nr:magnesium/cobalt transporter CorA [Gammaproteobacteria bacterium]
MIAAYFPEDVKIHCDEISQNNIHLLEKAVWIDLISPTRKEEKLIENLLGIELPSKTEMEEIEPSSRLYVEEDALFMTTTVVALSDLPLPQSEVVTFILTEHKLVTIRYVELRAFKSFTSRLKRLKRKQFSAAFMLLGLLDAVGERLADILEKISHNFDKISQSIFQPNNNSTTPLSYKEILQDIGANADLGTKVRESAVSYMLLISFLEQTPEAKFTRETKSYLSTIKEDIRALSDYAGFMSTKVNFLLDATLGMINIEQNNIIKIFSVAAVIFLPPTLIASMYGMNFQFMPELNWRFGYPLAIVLMALSAWLPYRFFKKKKWL